MRRRIARGFTMVELAIVVVVVAILVAFAVPKLVASVERSNAAEAFNYLSTIEAAQERHRGRQGTYAANLADLDLSPPILQFFRTRGIADSDAVALRTRWRQTLTRADPPYGYDAYTVTFTQDGFDADDSTISEHPEIDPTRAPGE